jgi:histidine triad (HIT) family protein
VGPGTAAGRGQAADRQADCLFCRIVAGEVPAEVVRDDEHTLAFRDINPQAPTHVLVIPKRHIENAATVTSADGDLLAAMLEAAREVARSEGICTPDRGYRLVFNVGPDALNSVPHLHLHLLGGRAFGWPPG